MGPQDIVKKVKSNEPRGVNKPLAMLWENKCILLIVQATLNKFLAK